MTLGEDGCQTRTGPVPGLLARLNSTVLSLMDTLGVRNVARQARYSDAHPEQAVQFLLDYPLSGLLAWESSARTVYVLKWMRFVQVSSLYKSHPF